MAAAQEGTHSVCYTLAIPLLADVNSDSSLKSPYHSIITEFTMLSWLVSGWIDARHTRMSGCQIITHYLVHFSVGLSHLPQFLLLGIIIDIGCFCAGLSGGQLVAGGSVWIISILVGTGWQSNSCCVSGSQFLPFHMFFTWPWWTNLINEMNVELPSQIYMQHSLQFCRYNSDGEKGELCLAAVFSLVNGCPACGVEGTWDWRWEWHWLYEGKSTTVRWY